MTDHLLHNLEAVRAVLQLVVPKAINLTMWRDIFLDFVNLITTLPPRHSGDQVHKAGFYPHCTKRGRRGQRARAVNMPVVVTCVCAVNRVVGILDKPLQDLPLHRRGHLTQQNTKAVSFIQKRWRECTIFLGFVKLVSPPMHVHDIVARRTAKPTFSPLRKGGWKDEKARTDGAAFSLTL